ncbi:MAG TPA: hypothetical protein VJ851_06045 [Jatrophihabitans sp.]|nr:hypothetical protein [Jatrophihabitans sp.]
MEPKQDSFKPPYMSFQTFWNYIAELASKPLPPDIDRSIMGSKSGTDQANLTAALITFNLMEPGGHVQDDSRLKQLVAVDEETRKPILAEIVREFYPRAVAVSEANATENALNEVFKDDYGLTAAETRRKCVTFFLHALRVAGLHVSPHFPQTRSGSGAPGAPKAKRNSGPRRKPTPDGSNGEKQETPPVQQNTTGDQYTVDLTSGGKVTVSVSVNLFDLTTDDRTFVIDLVDKLKGYGAVSS